MISDIVIAVFCIIVVILAYVLAKHRRRICNHLRRTRKPHESQAVSGVELETLAGPPLRASLLAASLGLPAHMQPQVTPLVTVPKAPTLIYPTLPVSRVSLEADYSVQYR